MKEHENNCCVVYAYSDENWNFYYIGKGKPKRPYSGNRYVKKPEDYSHIHILCDNLDEKTAYLYEKTLISLIGRKDLHPEWGTLLNSTNGGGGTSGYKWNEKNLPKISGANHHKSIVKNWCHIERGFVKGKTSSELIKSYPRDKLKVSALNRLSSGSLKTYKGWVFIEEDKINKNLSDVELSEIFSKEYARQKVKESHEYRSSLKEGKNNPFYTLRSWCHFELGFIMDKSCSDIVKMFPETGASISGLSRLSLEKINYHKGWIYIKNDLIDRELGIDKLKSIFKPEHAREIISKQKEEDNSRLIRYCRSGEMNPMHNLKGENHPSFGVKRSEETKDKISNKARSRFTRKNWSHPIYGEVKQKLACELVEMFPEQNLSPSNLSSVSCGARKSHKGWKCAD